MNSNGYDWRTAIEQRGLPWAEQELERLRSQKNLKEAPRLKGEIDKYKQEQEDIKNAPREQREIDMEKHARHSKWAAIIAAVAAVAAALISGYALFVALTSKSS